MNLDYYLMERDGKFKVVCVPDGLSPLAGRIGWNIVSGPHDCRKTAEKALEWITK